MFSRPSWSTPLLDTVAVNLQTGQGCLRPHLAALGDHGRRRPAGCSNTIKLPAGTIKLTIAGANEDARATGDLDIKGNLTITGQRIEQYHRRRQQPRSGLPGPDRQGDDLRISRFSTVRAADGGGLLNSGGHVTLSSVVVRNNFAVGVDGPDGSAGVGSQSERRLPVRSSATTAGTVRTEPAARAAESSTPRR